MQITLMHALAIFLVGLIGVRSDFLVRNCYDFNGNIPGGGNCNAGDISGCVDNNGYYHDNPIICAAVGDNDWNKGCWSRNPGVRQFRLNAICRPNPPICAGRHGFETVTGVWCA
eukprot:jgi/Botrbrau1/1034/Bobra.0076s0006.1